MRSLSTAATFSVVLGSLAGSTVLPACQPTQLGQCNQELAEQLVFDRDGNPAFAGQAMVEQSCAGCHNTAATGVGRRGAPADLNFDMVGLRSEGEPVAEGDETEAQQQTLAALSGSKQVIFEDRFAMFDTVEDGSMPPGELGRQAFIDRGYAFADGTPLPRIESATGQELYREWLACNGPLVERTGDAPTDGQRGARCTDMPSSCVYRSEGADIAPIPATWDGLTTRVFTPSNCLATGCHGNGSASAELSLEAAPETFVDSTSMSAMCGSTGLSQIVAGDPANSLLYVKLAMPPQAASCDGYVEPSMTCGDPMPFGPFIGCAQLAAVAEYINSL